MSKQINCSKCGKIFELYGLTTLCKTCYDEDNRDFNRIRQYLYEHPHAKIFEVSTNLNISVAKIKYYLREGRLEIIEKNNQFLKCDICGKPICSGTLCDDCSKHTAHDFKSTYIGNYNKSEHKLNYISSNNKKVAVK